MFDFFNSNNSAKAFNASPSEDDSKLVDDRAYHLADMADQSMRGGDELMEESLSTYVRDLSRVGALEPIAQELESSGLADVQRNKEGRISELVFSDPFGKKVDIDLTSNGEALVNGKTPQELRSQSVDRIMDFYENKLQARVKSGELSLSEAITLDTLYRGLLLNDPAKVSEAAKDILSGDKRKFTEQMRKELGLSSAVSIVKGADGWPALSIESSFSHAIFSKYGTIKAFHSEVLTGDPDYTRPAEESIDDIMRGAADLSITSASGFILSNHRNIAKQVIDLAHDSILKNDYGRTDTKNRQKLIDTVQQLPKDDLEDIAQYLDRREHQIPDWDSDKPGDVVNVNVTRDKNGDVSNLIFMAKSSTDRDYPNKHLSISSRK